MTHFYVTADTDDHAYGQTNCRNLAINNPGFAVNNADSHEYIAKYMPSRSCANGVSNFGISSCIPSYFRVCHSILSHNHSLPPFHAWPLITLKPMLSPTEPQPTVSPTCAPTAIPITNMPTRTPTSAPTCIAVGQPVTCPSNGRTRVCCTGRCNKTSLKCT